MPQRETRSLATEVLAGLVERVTFHNEENGFCVLRVKARGQRDLITMLGHAATISAGEFVQASGCWINDRVHGVQFRASFLKVAAPTTVEGIEKYLGSGMIRGIGPVYARKLVRAFGEQVFEIIEQEPARLREVTGIGPKRAGQIIAGWAEQKVIREIMLFLHSNGVGTSRAVRIYKTYGADAVQLISENPYRLARDIRGIGFVTADQIAAKLGIEKTALIRVRAGISYALAEAMDEGHCGLPADELVPLTQKLPDETGSPDRLGTGSASPVKSDSSNSVPPWPMIWPSATIWSPGRTISTSPSTTSSGSIVCSCPSRITTGQARPNGLPWSQWQWRAFGAEASRRHGSHSVRRWSRHMLRVRSPWSCSR